MGDVQRARPWGTMSAEDFCKRGVEAYQGAADDDTRGWQRYLAGRLGINERTVRRYASGESDVPPVVELAVQHLARQGREREKRRRRRRAKAQ